MLIFEEIDSFKNKQNVVVCSFYHLSGVGGGCAESTGPEDQIPGARGFSVGVSAGQTRRAGADPVGDRVEIREYDFTSRRLASAPQRRRRRSNMNNPG
jgi:hypothetical protein